jgi:hypothetical protein
MREENTLHFSFVVSGAEFEANRTHAHLRGNVHGLQDV